MRIKKMIGYRIKDALGRVGLKRRHPLAAVLLPAMGLVAFGAALGAGVGLMFAPSSGRRLRQDVGERLEVVRRRIRREARKHGLDAVHVG